MDKDILEFSVLSLQFFCEPKIIKKSKIYLKNNPDVKNLNWLIGCLINLFNKELLKTVISGKWNNNDEQVRRCPCPPQAYSLVKDRDNRRVQI